MYVKKGEDKRKPTLLYALYDMKRIIKGKKKTGGRNNSGKITVWSRGGGGKRKERIVLKEYEEGKKYKMIGIDVNPGRSGILAIIKEKESGEKKLTVGIKGMKIGEEYGYKKGKVLLNYKGKEYRGGIILKEGDEINIKEGRIGDIISNIGHKGRKGVIIRAGGSYGQIMERGENAMRVRLRSGEKKWIKEDEKVRIGKIGQEKVEKKTIGKAGINRWKGKRPKVRGVAMNPVDHPHGGGEGKKSGKRLSPWSKRS